MASSLPLTPSKMLLAIRAPTKLLPSTGRRATTSGGTIDTQLRSSPSARRRRSSGVATSMRSAARSTSSAAKACRTAASMSPTCVEPDAGAAVERRDVVRAFGQQP